MFRNIGRFRKIKCRVKGLNFFRKNRKVKRGNVVEGLSKIKFEKSLGVLII